MGSGASGVCSINPCTGGLTLKGVRHVWLLVECTAAQSLVSFLRSRSRAPAVGFVTLFSRLGDGNGFGGLRRGLDLSLRYLLSGYEVWCTGIAFCLPL